MQEDDKSSFTIIEHLEELRLRLLKCIICIAVLLLPAYIFSEDIIETLLANFCGSLQNVVYLQPLGFFFTKLKVSFFIALFASFPFIAFQIWQFVSPGLFKKERHYIKSFVFISTFFFLAGALFALFAIFPAVMRFAQGMRTEHISPLFGVQSVINLAFMLMLGFGLMFQMPVFVFILSGTGLVHTSVMSKSRPFVIIGIFVLAAILTPPDIMSQLAMALPAIILFEASLAAAKIRDRKRASSG